MTESLDGPMAAKQLCSREIVENLKNLIFLRFLTPKNYYKTCRKPREEIGLQMFRQTETIWHIQDLRDKTEVIQLFYGNLKMEVKKF